MPDDPFNPHNRRTSCDGINLQDLAKAIREMENNAIDCSGEDGYKRFLKIATIETKRGLDSQGRMKSKQTIGREIVKIDLNLRIKKDLAASADRQKRRIFEMVEQGIIPPLEGHRLIVDIDLKLNNPSNKTYSPDQILRPVKDAIDDILSPISTSKPTKRTGMFLHRVEPVPSDYNGPIDEAIANGERLGVFLVVDCGYVNEKYGSGTPSVEKPLLIPGLDNIGVGSR